MGAAANKSFIDQADSHGKDVAGQLISQRYRRRDLDIYAFADLMIR